MSYVNALLTEREGYVQRGRKDRVAQVDAELARMGVVVDTAEDQRVGVEEAVPRRSNRRRS